MGSIILCKLLFVNTILWQMIAFCFYLCFTQRQGIRVAPCNPVSSFTAHHATLWSSRSSGAGQNEMEM